MNTGKEFLPLVGWQLDPFGHSITQAMISQNIGLKGMVFQRMAYKEKRNRFENGSRIFYWKYASDKPGLLTIG